MKRAWLFVGVMSVASVWCHAQETGFLCIKASTGRAGVFVDGKYMGPAANFRVARTYTVPAGDHEVKLIEPRYEELTATVTIKAGKKTTIHEILKELPAPKPPFGNLRTENADKFAAVYVNDKFMGHVDEFSNFAQGLLLKPGDYTVRIVPASGAPITKNIKIEENKTLIVKQKLPLAAGVEFPIISRNCGGMVWGKAEVTWCAMSRNHVRPLKIDQAQFGAKVGRHMLEFGRNPGSAADRLWLTQYISDIYTNATQFRDGTFSGQGAILPSGSNARGPVWFYAKGNDVVVTDHSDHFVTILKDGVINNTSFRSARVLRERP